MHEVLADALALFQRIEPGRVHTGGARNVVQLAARPPGGGDYGLAGLMAFPDPPADGINAGACRGVRGWAEHFVEPVDHGRRLQVGPGCLAANGSGRSVSTTDEDVTVSSVCGACKSNAVTAVPQ